MREIGIQPDMLLCRVDRELLPKPLKEKISLFSNVRVANVFGAVDVRLHLRGARSRSTKRGSTILLSTCSTSGPGNPTSATGPASPSASQRRASGAVQIGVVGKYVHLKDSYKSLHEALIHGGLHHDVKRRPHLHRLRGHRKGRAREAPRCVCDAILVPGGFGDRGSEGKIDAIRYARESGIPFFGICLGMQLAVVEFARSVCKLTRANSREFDKDGETCVIDLMPDQHGVIDKGGTMRLGAYPCTIAEGTIAQSVYGATNVSERHRHRYEVSNEYRDQLEEAGLVLSGLSPDKRLVEMIELSDHPYFVGCQFHPEFKSKPLKAHPLFARFVEAAIERRAKRGKQPVSNQPVATTVN